MSQCCSRPSLCLATLVLALPVAGTARAEDAPAHALELHNAALELYAKGRYREAIAHFNQAALLDPSAAILEFNLGLIHEQLGEIDAAITHYRKSLQLEANEPEKDKLTATIRRLQALKKTGELTPPAPQPLALKAQPAASGAHPLRPWIWASAGAALGLTALGGGFAARAAAYQRSANKTTGDGVTVEALQIDARRAKSSAIVADVSFALAGAAGLGGIILAIVALHSRPQQARGNSSRAPVGVRARAVEASIDAIRCGSIDVSPGFSGGAIRWRF